MVILPKAICRFSVITIKAYISFFIELEKKKNYPKIHMEPQKIPDSQNNPEQKELC